MSTNQGGGPSSTRRVSVAGRALSTAAQAGVHWVMGPGVLETHTREGHRLAKSTLVRHGAYLLGVAAVCAVVAATTKLTAFAGVAAIPAGLALVSAMQASDHARAARQPSTFPASLYDGVPEDFLGALGSISVGETGFIYHSQICSAMEAGGLTLDEPIALVRLDGNIMPIHRDNATDFTYRHFAGDVTVSLGVGWDGPAGPAG